MVPDIGVVFYLNNMIFFLLKIRIISQFLEELLLIPHHSLSIQFKLLFLSVFLPSYVRVYRLYSLNNINKIMLYNILGYIKMSNLELFYTLLICNYPNALHFS